MSLTSLPVDIVFSKKVAVQTMRLLGLKSRATLTRQRILARGCKAQMIRPDTAPMLAGVTSWAVALVVAHVVNLCAFRNRAVLLFPYPAVR